MNHISQDEADIYDCICPPDAVLIVENVYVCTTCRKTWIEDLPFVADEVYELKAA